MDIQSAKYTDQSKKIINIELVNGNVISVEAAGSHRFVKKVNRWAAQPGNEITEFSQADIDAAATQVKINEALKYLKSTDWMVLRAAEDPNRSVPAQVKTRREQARIDASL